MCEIVVAGSASVSPAALGSLRSQGHRVDLLHAWNRGDGGSLEDVIPLVYERLCELASGFLSQERKNHTLQTGALVNEAYLRMRDLRQFDVERVGLVGESS